MYTYKIHIQFAKSDAPTFVEVQEQIEGAIAYFNSRSLIAKNPKQIAQHSISEDGATLTVTLESTAELPVPAKALRILTTHLIDDNTPNNLAAIISGKQLFKMRVDTVFSPLSNPHATDYDLNSLKLSLIKLIADCPEAPLLKKIEVLMEGDNANV